MKFNYNLFNSRLGVLANMPTTPMRPCTKLAMDNIVLPKWSEFGVFAYMHKFAVYTAEAPNAHDYDSADSQTVLRLLFDDNGNAKLLFDDHRRAQHGYKRPDNYCWPVKKVQGLVEKGLTKPIGIMSAEGLVNLSTVMNAIPDPDEKKLFAGMFAAFNKDMLLAHTPAENRFFIRVTKELYDAGWTFTVDEWQSYNLDENGDAEVTELQIGDAIIVNRQVDGSYTGYRIDKEMFEATHSY